MTNRRGVIARRAEELTPGISYVRGWSRAHRGTAALADRLRALGLDSDFPGLKADVNVDGDGLVCLGQIRPEAAQFLAQALVTGLALELADHLTTDQTPRRSA
ncbi:hypothetical protein ACWDR0_14660 [Streptomyces sp. NPDC003691]